MNTTLRPKALTVDPLPSWNEGKTKQSIVTFVKRVTKPGSPDFVPPAERIATFDNDGTLWCEQLVPVQFYFALDRLKTLAPQHPKWKTKGLFASLHKGDLEWDGLPRLGLGSDVMVASAVDGSSAFASLLRS